MTNIKATRLENIQELWNTKGFQLGLSVIDLQHLWLIHLVLKLEEVVTKGNTEEMDEVFHKVTPELINYTLDHFSLEENLLVKFGFPETKEHKQQHDGFIRVVEHRINERKTGDINASLFLVNFLKKWLYNHILSEDKKYGKYLSLRRKNVEPYFQSIIEKTKIVSITQDQVDLYKTVTGSSELHEISSDNVLLDIVKIWKVYKLSVNIPVIDIQHLWLVKMIVELEKKGKKGTLPERELAFRNSIKTAINYSKEHFTVEEIVLEKFRPSILKTHSRQHKQFLEFVSHRNEQNKQGLYAAVANLVADFKEWIVSHIAIDDSALRYISQKRSEELKEFLALKIKEGIITINTDQLHFYNKVRKML